MSRTVGRAVNRLASWLAIVAMALNALWPMLANAKPVSAGDFTELCTANGMQRMATGNGGTQAPELALTPHCSFCAYGADRAAAPPPAIVMLVVRTFDVPAFRPRAAAVLVPESFSYPPAPPRAPPVSA